MAANLLSPAPENEQLLARQQVWFRLEGHPYAENPERCLRAELHDALWMLTRQWQFGELRGEDAGSAVRADIEAELAQVSRFSWGEEPQVGVPQVEGFHGQAPWEAKAEAEVVPFDLRLLTSASFALRRLLRQSLPASAEKIYENLVKKFPAPTLSDQVELADPATLASLNTVEGMVLNIAELLSNLRSGKSIADFANVTAVDKSKLDAVGKDFQTWCEGLFFQPAQKQSNWDASRLEYRFAQSATAGEGEAARPILAAKEYFHGSLDWYAYEDANAASQPSALSTKKAMPNEPASPFKRNLNVIPTEVQFPGMPVSRFWEFENGAVNLCNLNLSKHELPKVLLAEFGLIYGNDWMVVPTTLLLGYVNRLAKIEITDVFGVKTKIEPASDPNWGLFETGQPGRLLLPYTSIGQLESEPIEKVLYFPSHADGILWAVEQTVPGVDGIGRDAAAAWNRWKQRKQSQVVKETEAEDTSKPEPADLKYQFSPEFPENWIPFQLVESSDKRSFERSRLRRDVPADPRGLLLTEKKSPYLLMADEMVSEGITVTRTFQRTRGFDGRVFTWLGRRKIIGARVPESSFIFDSVNNDQTS